MTERQTFPAVSNYLRQEVPSYYACALNDVEFVDGDIAVLYVEYSEDRLNDIVENSWMDHGHEITDWEDSEAPMGPGSPAYVFAKHTVDFIRQDLNITFLDDHEDGIIKALEQDGSKARLVRFEVPYKPETLIPIYKELKARKPVRLRDA